MHQQLFGQGVAGGEPDAQVAGADREPHGDEAQRHARTPGRAADGQRQAQQDEANDDEDESAHLEYLYMGIDDAADFIFPLIQKNSFISSVFYLEDELAAPPISPPNPSSVECCASLCLF